MGVLETSVAYPPRPAVSEKSPPLRRNLLPSSSVAVLADGNQTHGGGHGIQRLVVASLFSRRGPVPIGRLELAMCGLSARRPGQLMKSWSPMST